MPQFAPSVPKTAVAPITISPAGLNCEAELFLGPDDQTKVATSGPVSFISTGAERSVNLPVTMPVEGNYHVYLDVYAEDILVAAYQAIEDVIVEVPVAEFAYVSGIRSLGTFFPSLPGDGEWYKVQVDIKNIGTIAGICSIGPEEMQVLRGYEDQAHFQPVNSLEAYGQIPFSQTIQPGQTLTFEWWIVRITVPFVQPVHVYTKVTSQAGSLGPVQIA